MRIISVLLITLFLASCASSKMAKRLQVHETMLQQAITGELSKQEKLDVVGESFVLVLEESLSYSKTEKSVQHLERYTKDNRQSLDILINELNSWVGEMSAAEKVMLVGSLATKPYTQDLIQLVPKFERKVQRKITTFKIASKIQDIVSFKF